MKNGSGRSTREEKINKMLNGAQDEEEIFALTTKTSRFFITTNTKR